MDLQDTSISRRSLYTHMQVILLHAADVSRTRHIDTCIVGFLFSLHVFSSSCCVSFVPSFLLFAGAIRTNSGDLWCDCDSFGKCQLLTALPDTTFHTLYTRCHFCQFRTPDNDWPQEMNRVLQQSTSVASTEMCAFFDESRGAEYPVRSDTLFNCRCQLYVHIYLD